MSFSKVKPTEYFGPHVLSEDAHAEKVFQPEYCPSQGKWNWKFSTDRKVKVTRPSILCVTQKRAFMPLYIVLGHQRACMPVYIGKSGDLVGWHRCLTDRQQKIELLSFSTVSSLSWVTQCQNCTNTVLMFLCNIPISGTSYWAGSHICTTRLTDAICASNSDTF